MAKEESNEIANAWMIRPCEVYKEEYNDCKRLISRMYQLYVDGQKSDCSQWLQDYQNCMAFRNNKDTVAAEAVIAVELQRRKERLHKANANDIWEYRKQPPPEWLAPLSSKDTESASNSNSTR